MSIRFRLIVMMTTLWVLGMSLPFVWQQSLSDTYLKVDGVSLQAYEVAAAHDAQKALDALSAQYSTSTSTQGPTQEPEKLRSLLEAMRRSYPMEIRQVEIALDAAAELSAAQQQASALDPDAAQAELALALGDASFYLERVRTDLIDELPRTAALPLGTTTLASPMFQFSIAAYALVGLLLFLCLSRCVLFPLGRLRAAIRRLGQGQWNTDLRLGAIHEWADLQRALVHMREMHRQLDAAAHTDDLTGLPNRTRCEEWIESFAASRQNGFICLIDIDNLARINEALDSHFGDICIREIADRMRLIAKPHDRIGRYGGDKFLLIRPCDETDPNDPDGLMMGQALVDELQMSYQKSGQRVQLSVSIGIACSPRQGRDAYQLLGAANTALGLAKRNGGAHARISDGTVRGSSREMSARLRELLDGLDKREFEAHLQPIIDTSTGQVVYAEALARWQHDNRLIMPGEFISAAQVSGNINLLSGQVFVDACEQLQQLHRAGYNIPLAFNLSALELVPSHIDNLIYLFQVSALPKGSIEFEITEQAMLDNLATAEPLLCKLTEAGFKLTLDDFGTGYSSLTHLQRLPISKIKIDRSFVARLEQERTSREIISALARLASGLDLEIVAEGVEKHSQMRLLNELGCPVQQGYLFSPAVPAPRLIEWMRKGLRGDQYLSPACAA